MKVVKENEAVEEANAAFQEAEGLTELLSLADADEGSDGDTGMTRIWSTAHRSRLSFRGGVDGGNKDERQAG